MAFGIAKGFGFEDHLNGMIQSYFSNQPEISEMLLHFSHSSLHNAKGGLIAGFGIAMLFWSIMKVLSNIELSFNAVWGIKTARTIVKKFTEYIAIMLVAPILIIASGAVTVFISSAATHALGDDNSFYLLGSAVKILIELIPYILIWILFTFIYMAIPNTKVKFKHALMAGMVAGSLFNMLEWVYFTFQIGAAQKNAVYGSFAALPLFLVWVQGSWVVVLFGCEIAFSGQNVHRYLYEKEVNSISGAHKRKTSLLILLQMNKEFNKGERALSVNNLCELTKLPIRLVRDIINNLNEANLISEIMTDDETTSYLPARDLNQLKYSELVTIMDECGSNEIPVGSEVESKLIHKIDKDLYDSLLQNSKNLSLQEITKNL